MPFDPAHFDIEETIVVDDRLPLVEAPDFSLAPMDPSTPGEGATFRKPAPVRRPRPGRLARLQAWLLRRFT